MQLAIDGLIALVVVVSHLAILARISFLDIIHFRYILFVVVVTQAKWLAKVLWNIDIPDVIYLLVFIFIEKPEASTAEKLFYASFTSVFWVTMTNFFNFYLFRVLFNRPVEMLPLHLGILLSSLVILPHFLGLQKLFGLDRFFKNPLKELQAKYQQMIVQMDIILVSSSLLILFQQDIRSLFLSQTYLPGFPQLYIWGGIMVHLYILIRFVAYCKEVREREVLKEQEEHLRSLEAYNKKIEAAYKSVRSFKHDYENVLISMQTSIDSGDFAIIERTYQDILKKAGQELIESEENHDTSVNLDSSKQDKVL